ncbi:MAG: transporter substrate-binding domain-containing protein, partial [Angelakisella sp.]
IAIMGYYAMAYCHSEWRDEVKRLRRVFAFLCIILCLFSATVSVDAVTTKLRVAFNIINPPYQFVTEDGKCAGMNIDILNAIAKENNLVLEYIPMEKTMDCTQALDKGEVDLILGMVIDQGSKYANQYTHELTSSPLCMIATNSFLNNASADLNLKSGIAVFEYGTANYSIISKLETPVCLAVGSQAEVMEANRSNRADIMLGVKSSILYQLYKSGMENNYTIVHNYISSVRYAIVVQEGDYELKRKLNSGIASLRVESDYENIYKQWIIDESSDNMADLIKRIVGVSIIIGSCILVYIIISLRVKFVLNLRVQEQTREIQYANEELERRIVQVQDGSRLRNSIIEGSPNGMVLFDSDYTIRLINNRACALAGLSDPPIGENIQQLSFFSDILAKEKDVLFTKAQELHHHTISLHTPEGDDRTYHCNIHYTSGYGDDCGALLTVEDVTKEEKEKHEAFDKEKNKALNRLIAGIAHEIRNPLMSIRTFATLMQTKGGDRQFQEQFQEFVPSEVDRINKLVESLINYAKPTKGIIEKVDVKTAINECLYLTNTIVKQGRIRVNIDTAEGLCIEADKNQIKQIFINNIMNSIESMEKKLKLMSPDADEYLSLSISAKEKDGKIIICIRDEGMGMSAKEISRCTEPFFTTKSTGTGLGMSLSKHFIEENKGDLLIESREQEYTLITIIFRRCSP